MLWLRPPRQFGNSLASKPARSCLLFQRFSHCRSFQSLQKLAAAVLHRPSYPMTNDRPHSLSNPYSNPHQVVLLCDLHGHSRKFGVFAYGCEKGPKDMAPAAPGWPVPGSLGGLAGVPPFNQARLFPLMLHLNAPDLFCYRSCNFAVRWGVVWSAVKHGQ